jgi:hypothetical protein
MRSYKQKYIVYIYVSVMFNDNISVRVCMFVSIYLQMGYTKRMLALRVFLLPVLQRTSKYL